MKTSQTAQPGAGALHTTYIGLGTNIGDRLQNLQNAVAALAPQVTVLRLSAVYQSLPWGYLEQPNFLNQVLVGETHLDPVALLVFLKSIEDQLGRRKTFRYGPRLIDLDILFYDDSIIHLPEVEIPHPRMDNRSFVLLPLAEIAPDLHHPVTGKTIREMLAEIDAGDTTLYS